jgi:hypothetical protein
VARPAIGAARPTATVVTALPPRAVRRAGVDVRLRAVRNLRLDVHLGVHIRGSIRIRVRIGVGGGIGVGIGLMRHVEDGVAQQRDSARAATSTEKEDRGQCGKRRTRRRCP